MKLFVRLCIILLLCIVQESNAQVTSYKISRSEMKRINHLKKEGFANSIIGINNSNYFVSFIKGRFFGRHTADEIIINSYDANSLRMIATTRLINVGNPEEKKLSDAYVEKYIVKEDGIYVYIRLWDGNTGATSIYLKRLGNDLKPVIGFTKVLETKGRQLSFEVLTNTSINGMMMIYKPIIQKGSNLSLDYKYLDAMFQPLAVGEVELPLRIMKYDVDYFGGKYFRMDALGNIAAFFDFNVDKNDRQNRGESAIASILCYINTHKNTVYTVSMRYDNKNIQNYGYGFTSDNKLAVTGFYTDLHRDAKGRDIHGIFYLKVNPITEETDVLQFSSFPDELMSKINRDNTLINERGKRQDNERERISDEFKFIDVLSNEDKSITAYLELCRNDYVVHYSRGGSYVTYYSDRGTLFYYNIAEDGRINWYNTVQKRLHLMGDASVWRENTVKISRAGTKDFILYNSDRNYSMLSKYDGAPAPNQNKDELILTTVNTYNGQYKSDYPKISHSGLKSYEITRPNSLVFKNDVGFGIGQRVRYKAACIVGAIVFLPIFPIAVVILVSQWSKYQLYEFAKYELPK